MYDQINKKVSRMSECSKDQILESMIWIAVKAVATTDQQAIVDP